MAPTEVFYIGEFELNHLKLANEYSKPGWYWWYCWPGCLPDSEPQGPYESLVAAEDAIANYCLD